MAQFCIWKARAGHVKVARRRTVDVRFADCGMPGSTDELSIDVLINSGRPRTHYPYGLLAMKKPNALYTADKKY